MIIIFYTILVLYFIIILIYGWIKTIYEFQTIENTYKTSNTISLIPTILIYKEKIVSYSWNFYLSIFIFKKRWYLTFYIINKHKRNITFNNYK